MFKFPNSINNQATTVTNPCIPYVGEIPGGLQCGSLITLQGQTAHHHRRFSINFSSSPHSEPLPDTILHIDFRFDDNCIVRNSLHWDEWGSEERKGHFPLRNGELFEAVVLVEDNGFKIAINGKHFTYYAKRYPMCQGKYLIIKGHVHVNFIRMGNNIPAPRPSIPPFNPRPLPPYQPVPTHLNNPKVPLNVSLPNSNGRVISVQGYTATYHPERFSINLKAGCETAFHFDVRFNFGNSHNKIVCNSHLHDTWGSEESCHRFPFSHGTIFEIKIVENPQMYKVFINGNHHMNFMHRFHPYNQVNMLEINGDIVLTLVTFL